MSTEANGRARSPTPRHAPLLLPLLHSEWRRGLGRGGTPLPSRDRSRGNEPPLPCPLLPQREERGKDGRVRGCVWCNRPEPNARTRCFFSLSPSEGERAWSLDILRAGKHPIPKGLHHSAQGCARRATLGLCARIFPTLNGLQPHPSAAHSRHYAAAITIDDREGEDRYNPCRVGSRTRQTPRVARNAQPWAK